MYYGDITTGAWDATVAIYVVDILPTQLFMYSIMGYACCPIQISPKRNPLPVYGGSKSPPLAL